MFEGDIYRRGKISLSYPKYYWSSTLVTLDIPYSATWHAYRASKNAQLTNLQNWENTILTFQHFHHFPNLSSSEYSMTFELVIKWNIFTFSCFNNTCMLFYFLAHSMCYALNLRSSRHLWYLFNFLEKIYHITSNIKALTREKI